MHLALRRWNTLNISPAFRLTKGQHKLKQAMAIQLELEKSILVWFEVKMITKKCYLNNWTRMENKGRETVFVVQSHHLYNNQFQFHNLSCYLKHSGAFKILQGWVVRIFYHVTYSYYKILYAIYKIIQKFRQQIPITC